MAKGNYTENLVAALNAQETWTYAQAAAFAEEHGLVIRSVIGKLKSMEKVYVPKPVVTKTGEPVVRKSEIISAIESSTGVEAGTFEGLTKSTKSALVALAAAVAVDEATES